MSKTLKVTVLLLAISALSFAGACKKKEETDTKTETESKMSTSDVVEAAKDVVCTMEAKVCADGSTVGRISAKTCDFQKCPEEKK